MKVFYFSDVDWQKQLNCTHNDLMTVFKNITAQTDTSGLIIAVYFLGRISGSGGIAYVQKWLSQKQFVSTRGRWKFTQKFPLHQTLPERFKLIRLYFGVKHLRYPLSMQDIYGWQLRHHSFLDHLAFLLAHELHHFRRHHLGLHQREGENSANKWALNWVIENNYHVSEKKRRTKKNKSFVESFFKSQIALNRHDKFKNLKSGDKLCINYDPKGRYENQQASLVRPARKNAKRLVIETSDGKSWRWPMDWIEIIN